MSDAGFGLDHTDSVALVRGQTEVPELIAAGAPLPEVLPGSP